MMALHVLFTIIIIIYKPNTLLITWVNLGSSDFYLCTCTELEMHTLYNLFWFYFVCLFACFQLTIYFEQCPIVHLPLKKKKQKMAVISKLAVIGSYIHREMTLSFERQLY